jgi:predicted transcriptional regulator
LGAKPRLSIDKVKEALTKTNGYIQQAATLLDRTRQTVYNYIQQYPELKEFIENLQEVRGDLYENTLHKMALGEVANKGEEENKEGEIEIVWYEQPPHFPSLKLALEINNRYTPNKKIELSGKIDVFSEMSEADDES